MIKKQRMLAILTVLIIITTALSGCGGTEPTDTTAPSTTETAVATVPTTVATTTAPNVITIDSSFTQNTREVTWTETAIDPAVTKYVDLKDGFLKVRNGPGTEYAQVSALTDGMAISVIAKTDTNWYKMSDGYYVYGEYVKDAP